MRKFVLWSLLSIGIIASESHYDLGLGTIFVNYPSYMGSKTSKQLIAPIPYVNYESDKTIIDRGGIEQKLFDINELTLDISLGGSLPVDSESSNIREGMPDLDLAFEVGPRLKYRFYHHNEHQLFFRLPLRVVVSTDFQGLDYQGYLITPDVRYEFEYKKLKISANSGPLWANQRYHDYFYGVSNQYQTQERDYYKAKEGYSGYRNSIGIKHQTGSWTYGGFIAHFNLKGASYEDSPLVETNHALFMGTHLSYIFYSK